MERRDKGRAPMPLFYDVRAYILRFIKYTHEMEFFKRIFRRRKQFKPEPKQLRIDGVKTALTPTPDDAELAAQALLESRIYGDKTQRKKAQGSRFKDQGSMFKDQGGEAKDVAYYRDLSEKIRTAHEQERRAAMRYVAYVEEQLAHWEQCNPASPVHTGDNPRSAQQDSSLFTLHSSLIDLEHQLYAHQDAVERSGGELLKRWQKCLAECILREMIAADTDSTDIADNADDIETTD